MSKIPVCPVTASAKSQMAQPNLEIKNGFDREKSVSDAAYFRGDNGDLAEGDSLSVWLAAEADFNEVFKSL